MRLSYLQEGEGSDLVLLHGYLASKETFFPLTSYFSGMYRVTALDFPGMGKAEALPAPWSVSDYADWTAEALSRLGVKAPLLIAHSFGGRVAIKLLSRGYPFQKAVLTGCAGVVKKRSLRYRFRVKSYRLIKKVAPMFAERRFGSAEYRTLSPLMRESYKKIVNEDLRADAQKIKTPVLFLYGSEDKETPKEVAFALHRATPSSELLFLEGLHHFAFLEDPLAFRLAVEDFYADR